MNLRYIDWIWHVRGTLALAPGQTGVQAFDRLEPLFGQRGTSHQRSDDALTFQKRDQAAQDKMSVFDGGVLRVDNGVLRYHLISKALLFCFLAPLLFVALGQLTIALEQFEKPPAAAAKGATDKEDKVLPLNPIDKFLGAPAPEKPKKDGKDKDGPGHKKKASATSAYVFAGIFVVLYLVGRVLEDWLVRRLFRRALSESKSA